MNDLKAQILTLGGLQSRAADGYFRRIGSVAFANGCFDILHPGHLSLLWRAREMADMVVIGLNSDDSVRRLKGPGRPIFGENQRAIMLAALSAIGHVVIFDDDTPETVIRYLHPDVIVKGADWQDKPVAGREFVESYGGRVAFVPTVGGYSTTAILNAARIGAQPWLTLGLP